MFRHLLYLCVFLAGLAVVVWIGVGYIGTNPLGALVALVIGAGYLAGAFELFRYRQATATLQHAVTDLSAAPESLGEWLARLHASLRNAVRLRIEGERVALPAPSLTPYLVGLLVLLGMLGTLLGMMVTLRGTGMALESATDLQSIQGSLGAPIKGLAFAFGTSIAGVASSAMLGLLAALCRRERLQAVQQLDVGIATTLRVHSQIHQREQTFKLLQQQTELMPALVDRLQTMMAAIEQQAGTASARQIAEQATFHASTEATFTRLADSVEQSLKESVAESARAAGAALQPVVASTMAALGRETTALHDTVTRAVQQQLDGLSSGFESATSNVAAIWTDALVEHRQSNEALARDFRGSQERFAEHFEQRSAGLIEGISARLDATAGKVAEAWNNASSRQQAANEELVTRNQQSLAQTGAAFEEHATALVRATDHSHAELQANLMSSDEARLVTWSQTLGSMTAALGKQWEQEGEQAAARQQAICDSLERTAGNISAQSQAHASETIAEISRLVDAASEAPRVAAEVVGELRQKLSDSMVRDTAMLDERSRLLATLETLLDAVNHASTEQRTAVDALVTTSADLLDRVGTRFAEHIEAETGKLGTLAAQLTGSAVEVASLGEAFGAGVEVFTRSNDALMERLRHIATALDTSLVRSDEQLAYYVAQAKEVIDLSVLSQQQIIGDMQQLAEQRASAANEVA
ncbi:MAG: DUF802 domain-containing protein [Rhodanobacter sp.]